MANVASEVTFDLIKSRLAKKQYAPIYLLHGEEGFFIDELVKLFEQILSPEERDFNLYTFYAPEVSADTVMDACRRYPMMSDYQVVILKEVQTQNAAFLNRLHLYAQQPTPTTILVVCNRGEVAKSKDFISQTKANGGVIYESKRVDDRNMDRVIAMFIKDKGLNIETKGLAMLREFVGSDLSRLYNEIDKLTKVLEPGAMVTPEVIERNVGVSKDYNNFELVDALAEKNAEKAFGIVEYFRRNSKNNPTVLTFSLIWTYFSNLMILHFTRDKNEDVLAAAIGLKSKWGLRRYYSAMRNYNAYKTIEILSAIRQADSRSKGINSRMNEYDLLHDLVFRILTAQGKI